MRAVLQVMYLLRGKVAELTESIVGVKGMTTSAHTLKYPVAPLKERGEVILLYENDVPLR